MKPLPKSMREDYRYLDIKVDAELDRQKASEIVEESVKSYAGEKGLVQTNPKIINSESGFSESKIVVRINRESEDVFRTAMILSGINLYTLKVSGSSRF